MGNYCKVTIEFMDNQVDTGVLPPDIAKEFLEMCKAMYAVVVNRERARLKKAVFSIEGFEIIFQKEEK